MWSQNTFILASYDTVSHRSRTKFIHPSYTMEWFRLVGSLKLHVSFAEYRLFYRALLQRGPVIWRSLLIVATPYCNLTSQSFFHPIRSSITYPCNLNTFILASYDSVSHRILSAFICYCNLTWHSCFHFMLYDAHLISHMNSSIIW